MKLTLEAKREIDSLTLEQLVHGWRFHNKPSAWYHGEVGRYWESRIHILRSLEKQNVCSR